MGKHGMIKIGVVILVGLALLGGGTWLVSTRLLHEPPAPVHPKAAVVKGVPLDAPLANDPLPPVTTQNIRGLTGERGSSTLPRIAATTNPAHAKYGVVQFDTLALFPYKRWWASLDGQTEKPPDQIPATVKALGGKPTCIVGFINPLDLDDGGKVSHFMLMRTQSLCCYGAPITVQDWIDVKLPDGKRITPTLHVPVFVLGTLDVGEDIQNGYTASLYRMKADKVLPPGEVP